VVTLRASGAPLWMLCAGAAHPAEVRIDTAGKPAGLGSAVHEGLRPVAEGGPIRWDELPGIAERWDLDVENLRPLVAMGAKLWPALAPRFPDALSEVPLQLELEVDGDVGAVLAGHVDLLARVSDTIEIGDWKTGFKDGDYAEQMRAYMALAITDDPTAQEVRATVIWIRAGETEEYRMTRHQAHAWLWRIRTEIVGWDGVYRPGDHCARCPRNHECPAARALARYMVESLADVDPQTSIAAMEPARVVELYRKASAVEAMAKRLREMVKARVEAEGDLVGDGGRLTIEVEERAGLDTAAAWPVLEAAGFGDEDFAACVDVLPSKAKDVAAKKAGRGKGAAAVRALVAALEAAGATRTKQIRKLVVRR
jgi:hypothetical protein